MTDIDIKSIFDQALAKHREEVAKKQDEAAERRLSAAVAGIEEAIKSQVANAICGLEREKRLIAEGGEEKTQNADKDGLLGWLQNYPEETQITIRLKMLFLGLILAMALICMCLGVWGCVLACVVIAIVPAASLHWNILFGKKR